VTVRAFQHGLHRPEGVSGGGGGGFGSVPGRHRRRPDHRPGGGLSPAATCRGLQDVAAYVVVLAVLLVKPSGIFGETAKKKV
jgi:branched-chain amino acid transport system permease protein